MITQPSLYRRLTLFSTNKPHITMSKMAVRSRFLFILNVIPIFMLVVSCAKKQQTYTARRVSKLDDKLFAETNVFTVQCLSREDCILLCGLRKAGCLSVTYHSLNNFCRGYSVVLNSTATTFDSPGAEFYTLQYAPCPYDAGYSMYINSCLRVVNYIATAGITEAFLHCYFAGGSPFDPNNTQKKTAVKSLLSDAGSGTKYYLGQMSLADNACLTYDTTIFEFANVSCSTMLNAAVCVV